MDNIGKMQVAKRVDHPSGPEPGSYLFLNTKLLTHHGKDGKDVSFIGSMRGEDDRVSYLRNMVKAATGESDHAEGLLLDLLGDLSGGDLLVESSVGKDGHPDYPVEHLTPQELEAFVQEAQQTMGDEIRLVLN